MHSSRWGRFQGWLHKPLFGTRIVARDAVADTDLLPEETFPVFCSKCRYELRGLSAQTCPECATPFDRGRLLVQQFVFEHGANFWQRHPAARSASAMIGIGAALLVFIGLVLAITTVLANKALEQGDAMRAVEYLASYSGWFLFLGMTGAVLMVLAACILLAMAWQNRTRRQQVIDAIVRH